MFVISDDIKHKSNISNTTYYFILPTNVNEDSATESDLILVKMSEFVGIDPNIDYYPDGIVIIGKKRIFDCNGDLTYTSIAGKIIYESIDGTNTVKTADGVKLRHSFTSPAGYVEYEFLPIQQLRNKFSLRFVFSVSRQVKLSINASGDVFFSSIDEAKKYIRHLTFYGGELSQNDLAIVVNEKCIHYMHYDIFVNNSYSNMTHEQLFEYLCSISSKAYNTPIYLRAFPLKPETFEIVPII